MPPPTAAQTLARRAIDLQRSSGGSFDSCLKTIRSCNPALAREADADPRATIANSHASSSRVTPGQLQQIHDGVGELMREKGLSYDAAWITFARQHPQFANAMLPEEIAADPVGARDKMRAGIQQTQADATALAAQKAFLKLSPDATDDEVQVALKANGGRASGALNAVGVFMALAKFYAREHEVSLQVALGIGLGRYPVLVSAFNQKDLPALEMNSSQGKSFSPAGTSTAPAGGKSVPPQW